MTQPIISCPLDCLPAFAEVMEYDHPMIDKVLQQDAIYSPEILDIGANVGAFAVWASMRWPKNRIINSYEPNPKVFHFLEENTLAFNVNCHRKAVTPSDNSVMWFGDDSNLCSSLTKWNRASLESVRVETVSPKAFDGSDIVKIDCEGGEADILENITFTPAYLVVEWHSDELRIRCENALRGKMTLIESKVSGDGFGLLKFIRVRK